MWYGWLNLVKAKLSLVLGRFIFWNLWPNFYLKNCSDDTETFTVVTLLY